MPNKILCAIPYQHTHNSLITRNLHLYTLKKLNNKGVHIRTKFFDTERYVCIF